MWDLSITDITRHSTPLPYVSLFHPLMKMHRCQRFYVPELFYIYGEIGGYGSPRWEGGLVGLNLLHVLKFIISCLFVWFVPPSSNISWGQHIWSTVSCDNTTEGSKTRSRPCHLSSRKVLTSTPCPTVSFLVSSNVGNNTQCSNSRGLLCFNKIMYRETLSNMSFHLTLFIITLIWL